MYMSFGLFIMSKEKKGKANRSSLLRGSAIAAIGGIAAICFCVVFVVIRAVGFGIHTDGKDAENGVQYISGIENRDYRSVAGKIKEISKKEKKEEIQKKLESLDNEEQDIWSLFDGIVIVGDSRAEAFVEYDFLTEASVEAKKGVSLRHADEYIQDVVSRQPKTLVFSYGINDITGNWIDAESFINKYKELLNTYREELPDTDIFVCSIIPVTEKAIADEPTLENLPEYAEAIKKMCEDDGYIFMDCDSLFDIREYYERDGMHFTKDMYPIWGDMILRKVFAYESEKVTADSD